MKYLILFFALFIFSCEQPLDKEDVLQIIDNIPNIPPSVVINEGDRTISNGSDLTLTTEITDPDDYEFISTWSINEIEVNNQENFTFAAYPDRSTDYTISVCISDGQDDCSDSVIITVLGPPWTPEKLHVYIFPVGSELSDYTWVKHYTATDSANYWVVMNGANLKVQEHNAFFPDDPWYYLGGGV